MKKKGILCLFLVVIMLVADFAAVIPINAIDNDGENESPQENTGPGDTPREL